MNTKIILYILFFSILICSKTVSNPPDLLWDFKTFDSCFGQPAAGDIDGDGTYEIVFSCYMNDGNIYAINAEDGTLQWKINPKSSSIACFDSAPLLVDINNDNKSEVIVAASCENKTYCLDGEFGAVLWIADTRGSDSPPSAADINNDGKIEILHGEFGGYIICIDAATGDINWEVAVDLDAHIQTAPSIADLNNDGYLDFLAATWKESGNKLYAFSGLDRSLIWSFDLKGRVYHGSAVSDINNDGLKEVLLGDYGYSFFAVDAQTGTLKWEINTGAYIGSPASLADVDNDGNCEIFFISANAAYMLNSKGEILWKYILPDFGQSFRGGAFADIDNNSFKDIVFGTSNGYLIALDGKSGEIIWLVDVGAMYNKEIAFDNAPVLADINSDGSLDIFISGGKTLYPEIEGNYGYGFAFSTNSPVNSEWLMFQNNMHRNSNACSPVSSIDIESEKKSGLKYLILNEIIYFENLHLKKIEIYNIIGELIINEEYSSGINISKLESGIYFIKAENHFYKMQILK